MTVDIQRLTGFDAYDLMFPDYLATLSGGDQLAMYQAMTNSSMVWMGMEGNEILCAWGLIPPTLLSTQAYLWLYTTEHLRGHQFILVRKSQRLVESMLQDFPILVGHCKVENPKAIRWLRWLGAQFGEPQGQFIPFTIRAKQ